LGYFPTGGSFDDELRRLASNQTSIPLSAFFISTFTISILFYAAIAITYMGLAFSLALSRVFGSNMLKSEEFTFTILGIISFSVFEILYIGIELYYIGRV